MWAPLTMLVGRIITYVAQFGRQGAALLPSYKRYNLSGSTHELAPLGHSGGAIQTDHYVCSFMWAAECSESANVQTR